VRLWLCIQRGYSPQVQNDRSRMAVKVAWLAREFSNRTLGGTKSRKADMVRRCASLVLWGQKKLVDQERARRKTRTQAIPNAKKMVASI
jgi:hypothetical protein